MEEKKEIQNLWLMIVGGLVILTLIVGFTLYATGVISKGVMSIIFIAPVAVVAVLAIAFKRKGMM